MRFASRSAETPTPGKFFGHVVTIFSLRFPEASAGADNVDAATAVRPAPVRKERRFICNFPQ